MRFLEQLRDKKGRITIGNVITAIIALLVVGILVPIGIGTIMNTTAVANQTVNWNASVLTIFQVLLPIVALVGIAIAFIPKAMSD